VVLPKVQDLNPERSSLWNDEHTEERSREMSSAESYQWAMEALEPIQMEQHEWEHALDRVASAILEAYKMGIRK